jgi:hypothetical protein
MERGLQLCPLTAVGTGGTHILVLLEGRATRFTDSLEKFPKFSGDRLWYTWKKNVVWNSAMSKPFNICFLDFR